MCRNGEKERQLDVQKGAVLREDQNSESQVKVQYPTMHTEERLGAEFEHKSE